VFIQDAALAEAPKRILWRFIFLYVNITTLYIVAVNSRCARGINGVVSGLSGS
jgi:hypothetical protein